MSIKLITLNIEHRKHLHRIIPFLKNEEADVICLQEIYEPDFEQLKQELGLSGQFYPTCTFQNEQDKIVYTEGVAMLSKRPLENSEGYYYVGTGSKPRHFSEDLAHPKDRVLVHGLAKKGQETYHIGTTHFTWTPDGQVSPTQKKDFTVLMTKLKEFNEFILCGDFNAPRGLEMFNKFCEHFTDNLPAQITSTLDPKLHRKPDLQLAIDTIFSTQPYIVTEVKVVEGLSDHKAIVGRISISGSVKHKN